MNIGQALEDLTCLQVLQVMRRMSGLDLDAIATAMGRNRQTVGCWFGEAAADKFIPLPLVPAFCHALGSPLLLEWLEAHYARLLRDGTPREWEGDAERTLDLLVRGLVQAGNALALLRGMGRELSPAQGRQVSEASLLAVATLAEAAREARGTFPARAGGVRYFRADDGDAAPTTSRWRRLAGRVGEWWHRVRERNHQDTAAEALRSELAQCRAAQARDQEELARVKRLMGAMGYLLREDGGLRNGRLATARRLLVEGEAVGATGNAKPDMRWGALAAAETQTLACRTLVRELAGLVREMLELGAVPLEREPAARTLLDRAGVFVE